MKVRFAKNNVELFDKLACGTVFSFSESPLADYLFIKVSIKTNNDTQFGCVQLAGGNVSLYSRGTTSGLKVHTHHNAELTINAEPEESK